MIGLKTEKLSVERQKTDSKSILIFPQESSVEATVFPDIDRKFSKQPLLDTLVSPRTETSSQGGRRIIEHLQ